MEVISPLTLTGDVELVAELDSKRIIDQYRTELGLDVSRYYGDATTLELFRCRRTGYRFYHPPSLQGHAALYEHLQQFDWYYDPWRWEHEYASGLIAPGTVVLEIGCGTGGFLHRLKDRKPVRVQGLELSEPAARRARAMGLDVRSVPFHDHALSHPASYGAICAFQVLEHLSEVRSFLEAALMALRPEGRLILGVPNNNPYLYRHEQYATLNLPPHHMGLWDEGSLRSLGPLLGLKVESLAVEPLFQLRHFMNVQTDHYLRLVRSSRFRNYAARAAERFVRLFGLSLPGRNIAAAYSKLAP